MKYVCSAQVSDYRYRGGDDGVILTTLFHVDIGENLNHDDPVAQDDIDEVKWFKLDWDILSDMVPVHEGLMRNLLMKLKPKESNK